MIEMITRKFSGFTAMTLAAVFAFSAQASAVTLRYNENDSKWRALEVKQVPWRSGKDINNDYYGTNCFAFVKWVIEDENRGTINTYTSDMRALASQTGGRIVAQHLNNKSDTPSASTVKAVFTKAKAGDVVQMVWKYSSTTQLRQFRAKDHRRK